MLKEVFEFHQELGPNGESVLIQNFDRKPFLVWSKRIHSPITDKELKDVFYIIKNIHAKFRHEGAFVIGKEISRELRNKPKFFSQLSIVLGQKGIIAKRMFELNGKEDEISQKEIFEWLRCMELGLMYAVKFFNTRNL